MARTETTRLERRVEAAYGLTIDQIARMTLHELREHQEKRRGIKWRFRRLFPFVGRGTVLGDQLVPQDELDRTLDEAMDKI